MSIPDPQDEALALAQTLTSPPRLAIATTILTTLLLTLFLLKSPSTKQPPSIPERIPYVSNALLFLNQYPALIRAALPAFGTGNIVRFRLGPKPIYLVRGATHTARLLRNSTALASEGFILTVFKGMSQYTPADLAKFANDKSGRLKTPNPGTEDTYPRYWAAQHDLYANWLTPAQYSNALAQRYFFALRERLDGLQATGWKTLRLHEFMRSVVSESALFSLCGPELVRLTPDIMDRYWELDSRASVILYGMPRWLFPRAYAAQDWFFEGVGRWLDNAQGKFDWEDEDAASSDWDPWFGSRLCREAARWLQREKFTRQATLGLLGGIIFALQANTITIATWAMMHLLQRKEVLEAARREAHTALVVDGEGRVVEIDAQKLVALPLLQAIFAETLRLHVTFPLIREVMEDGVEFDGYALPKGAYVQATAAIEHHDEEAWATGGHPVREFWPERHLVDGEKAGEVVFSLAGKTHKFFPFGGGPGICPGRHFAKQEVLLTIAALLTTFEIELVEWINRDGSRSDREARDDESYASTMPPDREAKIRLKSID
ncbi:cytochrome p450 family protein [Podospora aff. communis PSN243]|uniref:Cytochrome p450 family protein n=1 Tax=Podospora aff. communis PSN243 TaxID=3040156 RepID=A0AAV9G3M7_9PEZI|nr:cytochrome p450 family protein [Podospora aff. communis PSN243]